MKKALIILLAFLMLMMSSCELLDLFDNGDADESTSSSTIVDQSHKHSFTSTQVAPICDQRGYTHNVCACGYEYIDNFINELGTHTFERGICTVCGEVDYAEIVNMISTEAIKANVSVKTLYVNKGFGFETQVGASNGSGVIINYANGEYYLLTNNHVVYSKELSERSTGKRYYVTDYMGNEYQATLIGGSARADYDLALLKFESQEKYTVLDLEEGNSQRGDMVVSLGQPEGQPNTITLGEVKSYTRVTITDSDVTECNVSFEVLQHDAYINNGSSGGALLDSKLNVIGINYAGTESEDGKNTSSYAIPVEKVYEYFGVVGYDYKPFNQAEK